MTETGNAKTIKLGKREVSKNLIAGICLALLIALQLANIIYMFSVVKTGKHSDESWSYGLANSYYQPHIYMPAESTGLDENEDGLYENEWITGDVLKSYVTVDEGQEFSYDSVLYNLGKDAHPPLYFMILHTICSFFPGQYSDWFSFSINIPAFIIAQIFLYLLIRKLTKSYFASFAVVGFYGFSIAGVNTFIFARQYALLVMFAVLLMYAHACLLEADTKKKLIKCLVAIFVFTACGSMTHYFFIPFAFVLAVFFCLGYLIRKRWSKLFSYGAAMLLGVVTTLPFANSGFAVSSQSTVNSTVAAADSVSHMPAAVSTVVNAISSILNIIYIPVFEQRFDYVIETFIYDFFGIDVHLNLPYIPMVVCFYLLLFAVIWIALAFIIKATSKSDALSKNESTALPKLAKKTANGLANLSKEKFFVITLFFATLFEWYFVVGYANPVIMERYTNRYMFVTYPAALIVVFYIVLWLVKKVGGLIKGVNINKLCYKATAVILAVICLLNNVFADSIYTFERPVHEVGFEEVAAETKDDVIMLLSVHWLVTCYSTMLYDAGDIFLTNSDDFTKYPIKMRENIDTDEVMLLVDVYAFQLILNNRKHIDPDEEHIAREDYINLHTRAELEEFYLDFFEETFPDYTITFDYADRVYRRDVFVYRLEKK